MCPTDTLASMRIVFAHFGSRIPKYLVLNILRTSMMYEKYPITLLTDQKIVNFQRPNISITTVQRDSNWDLIENKLSHPRDFRNNFWFMSLLRFIEIANFGLVSNEKILHIESDVITSPDLPLIKLDSISESLAFPLFNNEMGIASLLFVNKAHGARLLLNECWDAISNNSSTTDMLILGQVIRKFPSEVLILPSFVPSVDMLRIEDVDFRTKITENISKFGGIFDGADIGQFMFGEDSRNNRGLKLLRKMNPYSNLNVLSAEYKFKADRDFPYLKDRNQNLHPLYCIHIHSKNRRAFKSDNRKYLRRYFLNSKLGQGKEFEIWIFLTGLIKFFSRRISKVGFHLNGH